MSHSARRNETTALSRRGFLAGAAAGAVAVGHRRQTRAANAPQNPPSKTTPSGPLAMWALTGTLKSADVLRQLDAYRAAGWGVVLYPRWGLELEYLGPAWFERIRFIVEQADARAMEVWLYDEFCWPSGHAKGLVTRDRADLAAELLLVQRDGQSRTTCVPGSANLLLAEATARFLEVTHKRYAEAIGPFFGRCVRAIFTDEPSLVMYHHAAAAGGGAWQLPWSTTLATALGGDFPQRLAASKDIPHWPGWRDYWAAYTQVFHDAWVAPIADWCASHGVALTGHLLGENTFGSQVAFNGSLHRQLSGFGIPGIDEINTTTDLARSEALTLAAIAEFAGRERMVEAYALGPPHMKLETMSRMVDLCAACGVDRYVLAICPHDLRGGVMKREYLGIHGPQQPWFSEFARPYAEYVEEAAHHARRARPLGVPWPKDEELWAAAGPDPRRSQALQAMTRQFVTAARDAIRGRLDTTSTVPAILRTRESSDLEWTFEVQGVNSLRLDQPGFTVAARLSRAELAVQCQLIRSVRLNGTELDWRSAPVDQQFDLSYRRVLVTDLLRTGENQLTVEATEQKPLKFLPALILWGDFAVDAEGRLTTQPTKIPLGDWRRYGYPALCGTGRYRATADFDRPPTHLTLDTGGYPVRAMLNGTDLGKRAWPPYRFDLRNVARRGQNQFIIDVTSTVGHLFAPADSLPVGLLAAALEF